jgi:rsbT antagonist protein RsbS
VARVPIIRIGSILVATVQEDLSDRDAIDLQTELIQTIERTEAQGVLIDLSTVDMIDSFLGRLIGEIAVGSRLMGAETVVVGLRPAVALTLVELGIEFAGIHTALDTDRGHTMLSKLMKRSAGTARPGMQNGS